MENRFYYRIFTDPENNFEDKTEYITVNCTGHSFFSGHVYADTIRHDYYLMYICSGKIGVSSPAAGRPLEPGDLIIFKAGTPFCYSSLSDDIEYYWAHFTGYGAANLLTNCGLETGEPLPIGMHERLCTDFRELFDVFLQRDSFFNAESANRMARILIDSGRYISRSKSPKSHGIIQRSIAYIQNHITEPLSVDALAEHGHMSASRFRTLFREVTGVSPQMYLIRSKLNYACELLRRSDESVKRIGLSVGYQDPLYFSRLFKKHIGVSPEAYRQRYK